MNELERILTAPNLKMAATIIVLFAAIYSFVREKIPADLTALLAVLGLLLTGVLTPGEAFAGFSHPATVAVAAVLILSAAIEKTGALSFLARRVLLPLGDNLRLDRRLCDAHRLSNQPDDLRRRRLSRQRFRADGNCFGRFAGDSGSDFDSLFLAVDPLIFWRKPARRARARNEKLNFRAYFRI